MIESSGSQSSRYPFARTFVAKPQGFSGFFYYLFAGGECGGRLRGGEQAVENSEQAGGDGARDRDRQDPRPDDVLSDAPAHGAEALDTAHAHDPPGDGVSSRNRNPG